MRDHLAVMVAAAMRAGMARDDALELCRNVLAAWPEHIRDAVDYRSENFGLPPVSDAVIYAIANAADEALRSHAPERRFA